MLSLLSRLFSSLTLAVYLFAGIASVRVVAPQMASVEFLTPDFAAFNDFSFRDEKIDPIQSPSLQFAAIKFPVEKKVAARKPAVIKPVAVVIVATPAQMTYKNIDRNELPFHDPIELKSVVMNQELPSVASLYKEFKYQDTAKVAPVELALTEEKVEDAVSTKMAATEVAEPEFFEYPQTEEEKNPGVEVKTTALDMDEAKIASRPEVITNVDNSDEEIAVDDLISFDYSQAKADMQEQVASKVTSVTTQNVLPTQPGLLASQNKIMPPVRRSRKQPPTKPVGGQLTENGYGFIAPQEEKKGYQSRVTIQITGTDLKTNQEEVGFEVRPQDDLNEALSDYNNGSVMMEQVLAEKSMTRSVTVLKRGFAPTNTDIILDNDSAEVTVPLIEEGTFNEMMAPYESRGPIGAVLVELNDETEDASLDVPFSQVLKLNSEMNIVSGDDFNYLLFVGVKAGNALLSYKTIGDGVSKVIHVHEHELSYESVIYEEVNDENVALLEEDLLAKDKTPLIISAEKVIQFATDKTAKKINDHTFRTDFNRVLLGGRRYLELAHQSEPVFVGLKDKATAEIPSENFMRYILSRFEGAKLGNRCLVQVNLSQKAVRVDVGTEAVGDALQAYTQALDRDGKFYDSVGANSQKLIIVGEIQNASDQSQDAKINIKITYDDESVQFLGSYCSPNTYLVEQL